MADARTLMAALHKSQARLRSVVDPLSATQVAGPSYASEWTIARVLSHLGSQAEIFSRFLDAGLSGQPAPGQEEFKPIWDEWDAKGPTDQASDSLRQNDAFVARVEALTDDELERFRLDLFGMDVDAAMLIQMRLAEHAVHTWDIAVALDPSATVSPDAAALLVDTLGRLALRAGKAPAEPLRVQIHTTNPDRDFLLATTDKVEITPDGGAAGGAAEDGAAEDGATAPLELPAEALIRLAYGRLDPGHTPAEVVTSGVDLDAVRAVFPGV